MLNKIKKDKLELTNKSCNLEHTELKTKLKSVVDDIDKSLEQKESVEHNEKILRSQTEFDPNKIKV